MPIDRQQVKDWLRKNQRSQTWLALQVGISRSHLNGWCLGKRRHQLSVEVEESIAEITGLAVAGTSGGQQEEESRGVS